MSPLPNISWGGCKIGNCCSRLLWTATSVVSLLPFSAILPPYCLKKKKKIWETWMPKEWSCLLQCSSQLVLPQGPADISSQESEPAVDQRLPQLGGLIPYTCHLAGSSQASLYSEPHFFHLCNGYNNLTSRGAKFWAPVTLIQGRKC